jgi:MPBQ/MSBQ methyltransferase
LSRDRALLSSKSTIQSKLIANFYNQIAHEYDKLNDVWTQELYASLDEILFEEFASLRNKNVLDVGTGSGFQAIQLASQGANVYGIDIALRMLRVASYKLESHKLASNLCSSDAQFLPFRSTLFDSVVCCGSVLNYVPDFELAVSEFARVLRPSGKLILGIDNASSIDKLWMTLDLKGRFGLGYGPPDFSKEFDLHTNSYPYFTTDGSLHFVPERFLKIPQVEKCLKSCGIRILRVYGIHLLTSLIPFPIISNPKARNVIKKMGTYLAALDRRLRGIPGLNHVAYHVVIIGKRTWSN